MGNLCGSDEIQPRADRAPERGLGWRIEQRESVPRAEHQEALDEIARLRNEVLMLKAQRVASQDQSDHAAFLDVDIPNGQVPKGKGDEASQDAGVPALLVTPGVQGGIEEEEKQQQ